MQDSPEITIAGGGIGGLALALSLKLVVRRALYNA
jgi:2-polyprenyl-6-methoxyphenol hydroxylase-like FAD-dependent oxidoreductase